MILETAIHSPQRHRGTEETMRLRVLPAHPMGLRLQCLNGLFFLCVLCVSVVQLLFLE